MPVTDPKDITPVPTVGLLPEEEAKARTLWLRIQDGSVSMDKVNTKGRDLLTRYLSSASKGPKTGVSTTGPVPGSVQATGQPAPKLGGSFSTQWSVPEEERGKVAGTISAGQALTQSLDEMAVAVESYKAQAAQYLKDPKSPVDYAKGVGMIALSAITGVYAAPFRFAELEIMGPQGYEGFFTGGTSWETILSKLGVKKDLVPAISEGLRNVARPDMIPAELGAIKLMLHTGQLTKTIVNAFRTGDTLSKYLEYPKYATSTMPDMTVQSIEEQYKAAAEKTPKGPVTVKRVDLVQPNLEQKLLPKPSAVPGTIKPQGFVGQAGIGLSQVDPVAVAAQKRAADFQNKVLGKEPVKRTEIVVQQPPQLIPAGRVAAQRIAAMKKPRVMEVTTPTQVFTEPTMTSIKDLRTNVQGALDGYAANPSEATRNTLRYHANKLSEAVDKAWEVPRKATIEARDAAFRALDSAEQQVTANMTAAANKIRAETNSTLRRLMKTDDRRIMDSPSPKEVQDGLALAKARETAYRAAHDYLEIEGAKLEEVYEGTDWLSIAETNAGKPGTPWKIGSCGL